MPPKRRVVKRRSPAAPDDARDAVLNMISAARSGSVNEVRRALEAGVDVNAQDSMGRTAVHWCVVKRQHDVLAYLLRVDGVDSSIADIEGRTPLHHACIPPPRAGSDEADDPSALVMLTSLGRPNLNARDRKGSTPLMCAVWHGMKAVVMHMLSLRGLQLDAADDDGHTAEQLAELRHHSDIAVLLRCANDKASGRTGVHSHGLLLPASPFVSSAASASASAVAATPSRLAFAAAAAASAAGTPLPSMLQRASQATDAALPATPLTQIRSQSDAAVTPTSQLSPSSKRSFFGKIASLASEIMSQGDRNLVVPYSSPGARGMTGVGEQPGAHFSVGSDAPTQQPMPSGWVDAATDDVWGTHAAQSPRREPGRPPLSPSLPTAIRRPFPEVDEANVPYEFPVTHAAAELAPTARDDVGAAAIVRGPAPLVPLTPHYGQVLTAASFSLAPQPQSMPRMHMSAATVVPHMAAPMHLSFGMVQPQAVAPRSAAPVSTRSSRHVPPPPRMALPPVTTAHAALPAVVTRATVSGASRGVWADGDTISSSEEEDEDAARYFAGLPPLARTPSSRAASDRKSGAVGSGTAASMVRAPATVAASPEAADADPVVSVAPPAAATAAPAVTASISAASTATPTVRVAMARASRAVSCSGSRYPSCACGDSVCVRVRVCDFMPQPPTAAPAVSADEQLLLACDSANTAEVSSALSRGANVNVRDVDGRTALHIAAIRGHSPSVALLLCQPGVDVNASSSELLLTALHCAVCTGKLLRLRQHVLRAVTQLFSRVCRAAVPQTDTSQRTPTVPATCSSFSSTRVGLRSTLVTATAARHSCGRHSVAASPRWRHSSTTFVWMWRRWTATASAPRRGRRRRDTPPRSSSSVMPRCDEMPRYCERRARVDAWGS
jgi:ankyrin repeat protein